MSKKNQDDLIGRAVIDPEFRRRLLADPEGTIAAGDYEVSPAFLTQLKTIDPDAAEAAVAATGSSADLAERKAAG